MNKNEVTMQLYTTRKFQPYEPIFKFLSDSGICLLYTSDAADE